MSQRALRRGLVRVRRIWRDIVFRAIVLFTLVLAAIGFSWNYAEQKQDYRAQNAAADAPSDQAEWQLVRYTVILDAFTALLALSTLGLWIVTFCGMRRQIGDTTRSLSIAGKVADAAKASAEAAILNANAAVRSELPIVSPSHIALFESDKQRSPRIVGHPPKKLVFEVNFKNRGRSPAELIEICLEWHITDKLPKVPDYVTISPYAPGAFIDVNGNIPGGPVKILIRLEDDEVSDLPYGTVFLWVFGYIMFRDSIVGEQHISRFCAKWQPYRIDRDEVSILWGSCTISKPQPNIQRRLKNEGTSRGAQRGADPDRKISWLSRDNSTKADARRCVRLGSGWVRGGSAPMEKI